MRRRSRGSVSGCGPVKDGQGMGQLTSLILAHPA